MNGKLNRKRTYFSYNRGYIAIPRLLKKFIKPLFNYLIINVINVVVHIWYKTYLNKEKRGKNGLELESTRRLTTNNVK